MKRLLLAALLLAAGCQGGPKITAFSVDRNDVQAGEVVTLTYTLQNATQAQLDPDANEVPAQSGTHAVKIIPQRTVDLVLTASRPAPFVRLLRAQATLQLRVLVHAPVAKFAATPSQALAGTAVKLSWDARPATSVTITSDAPGAPGDQPAQGSLTVSPAASVLYQLQAHLPNDPQPPPVPLRVRMVAPPAVSLTAQPASTTAGAPVTLSWSGSGATGYALDNGIGYVGAKTSLLVRPGQTTTYHVTAYGPAGGQATSSAQVTITGPTPGQRALTYVNPPAGGATLALVQDAASTPQVLILNLVTFQAVTASGLALNLPLDASRAQLDVGQPGDASPGFAVSPDFDGDPAPLAAKAVIGSGPLAGVLTVGVALKATRPGVVPAKPLAPGTVIGQLRLVAAPDAQPGLVFDSSAAASVYFGPLPRDPSSQPAKIALGTLNLL